MNSFLALKHVPPTLLLNALKLIKEAGLQCGISNSLSQRKAFLAQHLSQGHKHRRQNQKLLWASVHHLQLTFAVTAAQHWTEFPRGTYESLSWLGHAFEHLQALDGFSRQQTRPFAQSARCLFCRQSDWEGALSFHTGRFSLG